MTYNLTGVPAANNILEILVVADNTTGGIYSNLAIATVFIIVLISLMRNNPPAESMTAASTTAFLLSLGLTAAGLGTSATIMITGLLLTVSAIALYTINRK